jgi:hypothetical protein
MDDNAVTPEHTFLETVRQRRADLRESISTLEHALAAPTPGRPGPWVERVRDALVELSSDFGEHIDITEGPDGLYQGLLTAAPRLSLPVERLTREHGQITESVASLLARVSEPGVDTDVDRVRDFGTMLLGRLVRHRQRGSDLVYEAYESDLGGET